ncbi:hypothetical protein NQ315_011845 [Exocentrus adspersus]|uniref:RGS domain-containing protein n=1 Tax=Exocentrus adspersus TaxID=1586481 RepID=A0AAV8W0T2_9CUCU|nr:hypothetical protein NQ315_011845 [Exocentrus adspersus]
MLQFWKKSGHDKHRLESTPPPVNKRLRQPSAEKENSKRNEPLPLASFDDEGLFDIGEFESSKECSRLSKTLQEIISDKSALGYFIQYMESRKASPYILCWLDIETLKADLNHCTGSVKKNLSPHHDSLSVSTDCDSYTADSNSLCDFSTATLSESRGHLESNGCDTRDNSDSSIKCEDFSISDKKNVQTTVTVDNALVIFKKYIAKEALCNINCSEELRKEVMENICNTEKVVAGNCFDAIQAYIYKTIQNEYFTAFLGTDFFCKHQIDVLTSGNVVLDDILYNETALFYFMDFLEQENQRCLLEFWMAASNLQQQLHDQKEFYDPIEAQSDAVVLYDKYFSLQALCPLGFSDKVRLAVEQSICGEDGLILDCFHLPLKIVEKVLERNYLKPFLASQLFYKYLSDLINTVQANGYSTNIEGNRHSPSDCSSEKSFSQSTFLALEVPFKQAKREKTTDMTIDTRELCDPDALWKRRKSHRLSLGRVNELGKYETEFEPEPDRKEFNLKDVVKKFVSLEEEQKKKEEMAWQVAEMIVKDITSITLKDQKT